jgi:hypothetical protein
MKMKQILSAVLVFLVVTTSCSKYEENQGLSLRSKKDRLCQSWNWNGYDYITMKFEKDGLANWTFVSQSYGGGTSSINGVWRFTENKDSLYIRIAGKIDNTYEILKLEGNDLWLGREDLIIESTAKDN